MVTKVYKNISFFFFFWHYNPWRIISLFHNCPLLFSVLRLTSTIPYTCKSLIMLGCLRYFHPVSSYRRFSRHIFFTGWGCQPHGQPPNWRTRVSHLDWGHHLDLSDMGGPTSSHTTASIALQNHSTMQAPPLRQSTDTFRGRQRGVIKAQNSRMCYDVRRISYRNEKVLKYILYIYKNKVEALATGMDLILLYMKKYVAKHQTCNAEW